MSLSSITAEIKSAVEQGQAWLEKTVGEHVPALLAEVNAIESNPIFKALEGTVLPDDVVQEIANVVAAFAKLAAARETAGVASPAAGPASEDDQPTVTMPAVS